MMLSAQGIATHDMIWNFWETAPINMLLSYPATSLLYIAFQQNIAVNPVNEWERETSTTNSCQLA
jgi:hypothetical protein